MKTQHHTDSLFNALAGHGLVLRNRIVMAPMTRARAEGNIPNDMMATYYTQRASAGLIVSEGVSPSPNGLGYARIPGIYSPGQIDGWKKVTDAVHARQGRIFAQIMHTGRISHPANMPEGSKVLAPSAIEAEGETWTDAEGMQPFPLPREMSVEEIQSTLEEYVQGARNAIAAGFDGVEIHAANGYLPNQFLNPHSNRRDDAYGGNIAGRNRFVLELAQLISNAIGKERTGIRLSPYGTFNSMHPFEETFETYDQLTAGLEKIGLLYVHVLESPARGHEEGRLLMQKIRDNFSNVLIVNGDYTASAAAEVVADGRADLVAFGRSFIANPDLPERIRHELPLETADPATFYSAGEAGYLDYAPYPAELSQSRELP